MPKDKLVDGGFFFCGQFLDLVTIRKGRYMGNWIMKMADLRCDKSMAFNFDVMGRGAIGYLLNLSLPVSGKTLIQDFSVANPENPTSTFDVAGVFEYICWDASDEIGLCMSMSPQNKAIFTECVFTSTESPVISLSWVIYEYDYHSQKYFRRFHTNDKTVNFQVEERSLIKFNSEPDRIVRTPLTFQCNMDLTAHKESFDQELFFATSSEGATHKRKLVPKETQS